MDDVYLLNSPFTFQSMEKHAAYCAMIRCGLKVPRTVLVPFKHPPDNARWAYTAARYNRPFDLDEIAERVGYPLFMKPYDGGQWVGVTRIGDERRAAPRLRRLGRAAHAPAGGDRRLRRLRPLAVDRPRDDGHALPPGGAAARSLRGLARLPHARGRRGGRRHQPPDQRVLPLGVQLLRVPRARRRGLPHRLRQRLPRRRPHEPALLLPVGDQGAREVVHVLRGRRPARAARPRHARRTSTSATATTSPTRRSSSPTAGWPTTTSRPTAIRSSAPRASPTSTSWCSTGSPRPSSTRSSSTPCAACTPATSTSASSRTSAAWSASGCASRAPSRRSRAERTGVSALTSRIRLRPVRERRRRGILLPRLCTSSLP